MVRVQRGEEIEIFSSKKKIFNKFKGKDNNKKKEWKTFHLIHTSQIKRKMVVMMAPRETDNRIEREETIKTIDSTRMAITITTIDNGIIIETINPITVEARKMDLEVVIIYLVASESDN